MNRAENGAKMEVGGKVVASLGTMVGCCSCNDFRFVFSHFTAITDRYAPHSNDRIPTVW